MNYAVATLRKLVIKNQLVIWDLIVLYKSPGFIAEKLL